MSGCEGSSDGWGPTWVRMRYLTSPVNTVRKVPSALSLYSRMSVNRPKTKAYTLTHAVNGENPMRERPIMLRRPDSMAVAIMRPPERNATPRHLPCASLTKSWKPACSLFASPVASLIA